MEKIFVEFCDKGIQWGPGLLIGLVMIYAGYKLAHKVLTDTGLKIVAALDKPSQALNLQAQSMDRLTNSIQDYVHRDANEHQEIIILQKVIRDELKGIRNQSEIIEQRSDRIERRLGEMNGGPPIRNA